MSGGILQLIFNGMENIWIDHEPQITFFKKIYRRHTPFATETIPVRLNKNIDFGMESNAIIQPIGDLVHRIFFVFDIPQLSAAFLNTKQEDILNLLSNSKISDNDFYQNIKYYLKNSDELEVVNIINLIDSTLDFYQKEKNFYESAINQTYNKKNFIKYCFSNKKEYYLIYYLIKYIYKTNRNIISVIPINDNRIIDISLYSSIFSNLLFHKEILTLFHLENNIEHKIVNQKSLNDYIFNIYDNQINGFEINNPIDFNTDIINISKKYSIHNDIYDFGPSYYYILNIYNTIIAVIKKFAKTVPIISVKFLKTQKIDIYNDINSTPINNQYYNTIIDPNFKAKFMINNEYNLDNFMETSFFDDEYIFPNKYNNEYMLYYNKQAIILFDNIGQKVDKLIETYRTRLFSETKNLFYNNIPPINNIYCYAIATSGHENDNKIFNVFNLNIWFFYFFKYLDSFNENNFINYIRELFSISDKGLFLMKNIITLMKINIEYYMNDISYLLNDMYQDCPSINRNDTMKNYVPTILKHGTSQNFTNSTVPPFQNKEINGINVNDLLSITFIFHRNHIPSILEMFQFMYYFIDHITIEQVKKYLKISIIDITDEENKNIREIIKIFYYNIFAYFMKIYDKLGFEAPANYSTYEYGEKSIIIEKYVNHFLRDDSISLNMNQLQKPLKSVISQMEFYFTIEMLHIRELQKFYSNILFDNGHPEFIGSTTLYLINLIKNFFVATNNGFINVEQFDNVSDGTRKYYDELFQHNILNQNPDNLYYSIFNLDRYCGKAYLYTSYSSRNGNYIHAPIIGPLSMPPSDIYGISNDHYDNTKLINETYVQLLNNNNSSPINVNNKYELFKIDYFRIKHSIFNHINNKSFEMVDQYQLNLLCLLKQTEQIKKIKDKHLIIWIKKNLTYVLLNTDKNIIYEDILGLFNFSTNTPTISEVMNIYHYYINININNPEEKIFFPSGLLEECLNMLQKLLIKLNTQNHIYTYTNLLAYNRYISDLDMHHNILNNIIEMKNNFISQYYYYIKNKQYIISIHKLKLGDNILNYNNINVVLYAFLSNYFEEDKIKSLKEISNLVYLFPNSYPNEIFKIFSIMGNCNDFFQYIFRLLFNNNTIKRMTLKDTIDMLNITFDSTIKIFNYSTKHKILDIIMNIFSEYNNLLLNKYKLIKHLEKYFENVLDLNNTDIDNICVKVSEYGINCNEYHTYLNRIINESINKYYFLIKIKKDLDFFLKTGFKDDLKTHIINSIFNNIGIEHDALKYYFNLIDNENYLFLYNGLNYLILNSTIINPLNNYDKYSFVNYKFDKVNDLLQFLMDDIENNLFVFKKEKINDLNINDILNENIKLINTYHKEVSDIKSQICNILYRNKLAKTAWIRKLAHYLVKEISIKANDQIIDINISDWFEAYHEISKNDGSENGYNKMIGNRDDLTIFDDKLKKSYTIVLPFIFYFNRYSFLSIPLTASINVTYEVNIKLRTLEEVTYKEQYSNFIDPIFYDNIKNLTKNMNFKPELKNAYLMVEYIYLSKEERKIFVSNKLEYLIEEIQFDNGYNISDNNLIPVYKVGQKIKTKDVIKDGKKGKERYYSGGTLMDKNELGSLIYSMDLLSRNDFVPSIYYDQTGIKKLFMIEKKNDIDKNIWYKKIEYKHNFNNLVKLMVFMVKMNIHTQPSLRKNETQYFLGEHQWDNYGLYSYYDLSKIVNAKRVYYDIIKNRLNNINDETFGFINIINRLIMNYSNEEFFLKEKLLETMQIIKEAYMRYNNDIKNFGKLIKLKENLISLHINFPIYNKKLLLKLAHDILIDIGSDKLDETIIKIYLEYIDNCDYFCISKEIFKNGLIKLVGQLGSSFDKVYDRYNESQIDIYINIAYNIIELGDNYNLYSLNDTIWNYYLSHDNDFYIILSTINGLINSLNVNELYNLNNKKIDYFNYKNIIYQLLPVIQIENITDPIIYYENHISYDIINFISKEMNRLTNKLFDELYVNLIDYRTNLIENPKVNPLKMGFISINGYNIMPKNASSLCLSEIPAYISLNHTPNVGINLYSWAINALSYQPSGVINMGQIDNLTTTYYLDPLISNDNPAEIMTIVLSLNIMRYLSGLCGKAWK